MALKRSIAVVESTTPDKPVPPKRNDESLLPTVNGRSAASNNGVESRPAAAVKKNSGTNNVAVSGQGHSAAAVTKAHSMEETKTPKGNPPNSQKKAVIPQDMTLSIGGNSAEPRRQSLSKDKQQVPTAPVNPKGSNPSTRLSMIKGTHSPVRESAHSKEQVENQSKRNVISVVADVGDRAMLLRMSAVAEMTKKVVSVSISSGLRNAAKKNSQDNLAQEHPRDDVVSLQGLAAGIISLSITNALKTLQGSDFKSKK